MPSSQPIDTGLLPKQFGFATSALALLHKLTTDGGKVVCLASLSVEEQTKARAAGHVWVDGEGMGFAWCKDEGAQ